MAKGYVMCVFALALVLIVHATARNVPSVGLLSNHEQTNTVNVPNNAIAPNGRGVKDKKCGVVFGGVGGAAGVGAVGVIPLGGVGGLGGLGGGSGLGGLGGGSGLGGLGGKGGIGGVGGGVGGLGGGGVGGVGGVLP